MHLDVLALLNIAFCPHQITPPPCFMTINFAAMLLLLAGLKLRQKALLLADRSQGWWTAQKQAQPTFLNHKIHKGRSALHDAVDGGTIDCKSLRGLMC